MADAAIRQIFLLKNIPTSPKVISTRKLHELVLNELGDELSYKTIERDVSKHLSLIFPIISIRSPATSQRGWCFEKNHINQSLPGMTAEAALTLLMAEKHINQLLPNNVIEHIAPHIAEAKQTLETFNANGLNTWLNKVRIIPNSPLMPTPLSNENIEIIYTALLKNQVIEATYKGKPERIVKPLGLIQRGSQFYLITTFFDFEDIRITALQRYNKLALLDETFAPNKTFNLDAYIKSGEMAWPCDGKGLVKLKLEVSDVCHSYLNEFKLSDCQSSAAIKNARGVFTHNVKAQVLDTHELRHWILSQGTAVKVVAPVAIKNWIKSTINELSDFYS